LDEDSIKKPVRAIFAKISAISIFENIPEDNKDTIVVERGRVLALSDIRT
jgi:hypothetical protein